MRDVNVDGKIILDYHIGPNAGQSLFRVTSATSKSFTFFYIHFEYRLSGNVTK